MNTNLSPKTYAHKVDTGPLPIHEVRRINLVNALNARGRGARTALAVALNVTQAQVGHWLRPGALPGARPMTERHAHAIEEALRMMPGTLDRPLDSTDPTLSQPMPLTQPAPLEPPRPRERSDDALLDVLSRVAHAAERVAPGSSVPDVVRWARGVYAEEQQHGPMPTRAIEALLRILTKT